MPQISIYRIRQVAPICTLSNNGYNGPSESAPSKRHLDRFSVFAGLARGYVQQTDRQRF